MENERNFSLVGVMLALIIVISITSLMLGISFTHFRSSGVASLPPEARHIAEGEKMRELRETAEARDRADMQGLCTSGMLKSTRNGLIVTCQAGEWVFPH